MRLFFIYWAQIVLGTLGVLTLCGLTVEACYRLCFRAMGRRSARLYWFATSWLGTPVHELGHAVMCLLFGHRIERIRLIPTKKGGAMVEHSYNRKNPYAVFGNLWIALGPVFLGLAMMLLVLCLVYPVSTQSYLTLLRGGLEDQVSAGQIWTHILSFVRGLFTEPTRPLWARLLGVVALFSLTLHIRLSAADIRGMVSGLPIFALLSAALAVIFALLGAAAGQSLALFLWQFSWVTLALFGLILLFAVAQLLLALVCRMAVALFVRKR